jgi:condensin complex subunit 1
MFSLLSAGGKMEEESFRRIVKFLLGFVEKVCDALMVGQVITNALTRTNTPNSWPRSLLHDSTVVRLSDNGTMLHMRWAFCSIRMKRLQSWCLKATELFNPLLKGVIYLC